MPQFVVAQGGSVIDKHNNLHGPGSRVDGDLFTPKGLQDAINNRFLVPRMPEAAEPDALPPGVSEPQALQTGEVDADAIQTSTQPAVVPTSKAAPVAAPSEEPKSDPSGWTLDPALLAGKSVDELNAMIAERLTDAEREPFLANPFASAEEAIEMLSSDFTNSARGRAASQN